MSGEKDLSAHVSEGRARATLAQIRLMRPTPHEVTAEVVRRKTMFGRCEEWRAVSGHGEKAIFELVNMGE